ncbi:MAG: hypothetical protein IT164_17050 [Bryobacterales bacterium]|nr:hypothetical protein [Bryobacterales bacterium]
MFTPMERLALLAVAACGLAAIAVRILLKLRLTPAEREHRRRSMINRIGRMSDAMLTDAHADTLYYLYSVNGVDYNASQDVSALRDRVPAEPSQLIGHVTLKYAPRNPANSIVLCEEWSGLRTRTQEAGTQPAPAATHSRLKENELG